jgi:hypothetical protein
MKEERVGAIDQLTTFKWLHENNINVSGLFRYRIEGESAIGFTLLLGHSNVDPGSLLIKFTCQHK